MIELGQLRRWKEDFDMRGKSMRIRGEAGVFLVASHMGKFYANGSRAGDPPEDHWQIMMGETIHSGWSSSLLEDISEAVSGAH